MDLFTAGAFFLDGLCSWDALIADDYEFVLPLPYRSKFGIHYIYTPYFIGQLGIISSHEISEKITAQFLHAIPPKFRYVDLILNEGNKLPSELRIESVLRNNFVLSLKEPYHLIEQRFTKDGKKNLRPASEYLLHPEFNIDISLVVNFFKLAYGAINDSIRDDDYENFEQTCRAAIRQGLGFTIGIKNKDGEMVAVAFLGKDEKRLYYMLGAPSTSGRKMNAQHVLVNEIIKKYAGSDLKFDFEGSDIPSVATFYKKFSPELYTYHQIKINRLPLLIRWLKK